MLQFCPLCQKNGYKRRIKLSQLNLREAVWLCESSECPWPFGYQDFTFVSRNIGETWSSEWELRRPTASKSSEPHQISLNELGLDTPPVTPGSGSEVIHKDSVFVENTCSPTSLSLSPNSVVQRRLVPVKTKSDFSLVDDLNFETLDKCRGFKDACDAAEALTESIFNVIKPPSEDKLSGIYENLNCHESTVKCNKWLSDNTKSTVARDHCYSSSESSRIGIRLKRESKKLPRVKSIKKTNLKLIRSNSTRSEDDKSTMIVNDFEYDEGNKIPTMDGLVPIDSSHNAPSFVETCVTVPWSIDYGHAQDKTIVKIDPKPEPVVNNNPVVLIKIKAEDLESIRGTRIIQSSKNPKIQSERKLHGPKIEDEIQSAGNKSQGRKENNIEGLVNLSDIMKKPQKRTFPKTAKYQGFNFGSLKKKSKRNISNNEESMKSSLPNLPSPDNASTCSDVTCSSECSYTTATTTGSKSSLDSEDVSLTSSSDVKSTSTIAPQTDDANLNLDLQVLDELMLCDGVELPQGFNDDWLVSLFE